MKRPVTRSLFTKVLTWILLIQVVNVSIDPLDPNPAFNSLGFITGQEDLSINDIESFYELVSEQYLGVEVPEQDEDDESGFLKVMDFYFSESYIVIKPHYSDIKASFTELTHGPFSVLLEDTSPPPRRV